MDEVQCKSESDKPTDETFLLLSTSLNSISSYLFESQTSASMYEPTTATPTSNNQYTDASSSLTTITSVRNNRATYVTNTLPLSESTIVHTCCYKHHCQLSACHINNGKIQGSTSKKLLLSVPLQRKRKKVIFKRDFIDAIGIDERNSNLLDLTSDQRLVIAHYSCVEKFTNMYTSSPKDSSSNEINPQMKSTADNLITTNSIVANDKRNSCSSDIIACESNDTKIRSKCDRKLAENLKVQRMNSVSPISDEGLANASPYCSSGEEDEARIAVHEKVERSSSSDSALGLEDEILAGMAELSPRNQQRRMTLTVTDIPLRPALLPVAEPTSLPDSPLPMQQPSSDFITVIGPAPVVVPSKMILEARIVEIPTPNPSPIPPSDTRVSYFDTHSRRESIVSDTTNDDIPANRVRIVRTPSVVVSDYSDDVLCGITMEELEFFRQHRKLSLGATENTDYLSDMSAASSCSNLNYCGSSISLLDDTYNHTTLSALGTPMLTPERKLSTCSTCSTSQEENAEFNETNAFSNSLIDALRQQQRKKKVCKCSLNKPSSHSPLNSSENIKK